MLYTVVGGGFLKHFEFFLPSRDELEGGESPTQKLNPPREGEDENSKTWNPRNLDFGTRVNSSTILSACFYFDKQIKTGNPESWK